MKNQPRCENSLINLSTRERKRQTELSLYRRIPIKIPIFIKSTKVLIQSQNKLKYPLKKEKLMINTIIAIHGSPGHYKTSCTDRDSCTFWLQDILLQQIPNCRIFSFGYKINVDHSVEKVANTLLQLIDAVLELKGPIIFFARSFGVLLLKAVRPSTFHLIFV